VDLSLCRVVTDRCRGQVLPFGVRQMIKDYAWVSFDNETLRAAVRLWCSDRATAYARYGDINDWDVSRVRDTVCMHYGSKVFNHNPPLDRWNPTTMETIAGMFKETRRFNQPLISWDIATIANIREVFTGAVLLRPLRCGLHRLTSPPAPSIWVPPNCT
jgi:hypothetical protein